MSSASRIVALPTARDRFMADGLRLCGSVRSVMWEFGDWWNNPPDGVDRSEVVRSEEWRQSGGFTPGSCQVAGSVAKRFPPLARVKELSFEHHKVVAPLPDEKARPLLEAAANQDLSASELRGMVKQERRAAREVELAEATRAASERVGERLYGVIAADPPWRFEPYSRETGMDRAADNHYPTMSVADICALKVPAARNCVLFLWATVPMLPEALEVMLAWGFSYKSHCVWVKDRAGTGYWFRNRHELLLVGVRGDVPAPAPGDQYSSVIEAKLAAHSAKPAMFYEIIDDLFPNVPSLEMFAREKRAGWDAWGNQA